MIDIPTIALVLGLTDLSLAVAAAVYSATAPKPNTALGLWRWGRALVGAGLLLVWMRSLLPISGLPTLSHLLMLGGSALELGAFALLLDLRGWRLPLTIASALMLLLRLALPPLQVPAGLAPVYFSFAMGGVYAAMGAMLLLRQPGARPLLGLIGINNLALAILFLVRAVWGALAGGLNPSVPTLLTSALWLGAHVVVVLNGYGFLLISRQQEDARLARAHARTAAAEAGQRKLLSMASHEFRTPAAMIQTSLDSLRYLRADIPPAVAARLDNIALASRRLSRLANVLLCRDRLTDGDIATHLQPLDIAALAAEVAGGYDPPVPCVVPAGLPPLAADADLLRIALQNLLDNALLHGAGAAPPQLRLRCDGDWLEFTVADTGPGVADADKVRIFGRFQQGQHSRGSGLGLFIVSEVARLHGGDVAVRDRQPQGAEFLLRLPLHPPAGRSAIEPGDERHTSATGTSP